MSRSARSYPSIPAPPPSSSGNVRRRKKVAEELPAEPAAAAAAPVSTAKSEAPPPMNPASFAGRPKGESRALKIVRAIVGVALVAGIGSGVAYGARRYVKTSPRFAVNEIVTSGGKRRGPDEIANIAGIAKGQNVFSVDLDRARARLANDPWIESAVLTRQLPSSVTIHVTEREAAGMVVLTSASVAAVAAPPPPAGAPAAAAAAAAPSPSTTEGTYLVTREGAIIKRVEPGDPVDFHIVTGLPLKTLIDDREGAMKTVRLALDLATDYERSPLAQRSPIEEVHIETNGDMTLVVGKQAIAIRMGAAPYRKKIDQAVRTVAELDRRGAKAEIIMLDDEARADRVVVRMR